MKNCKIYFIADKNLCGDRLLEIVEKVILSGIKIVQLRFKEGGDKKFIETSLMVKKICKSKALLIINDRVDIAVAVKSDGVHLGQDDIPIEYARKILKDKIIGISCDNLQDAIIAEKEGADYVAIGPIFRTKTKSDAGEPKGVDIIKLFKKNIKIPVVAVGGIHKNNINKVIKAGANSVAISSAIIHSKNIELLISELLKKFEE